jgi:hypothetical protein
LDAVGKTANRIGKKLSQMNEEDRPGKVIFLIITDGMENRSREFNYQQIKDMIERQRNVYKWEFLFFGANIDSFDVASSIGISGTRTANFSASSAGISSTLDSMSIATRAYRVTGTVPDDYSKKVQ